MAEDITPPNNVIRLPTTPKPGSEEWRSDRDLMTLSDLIKEYAAGRNPRGDYRTPLPDDLIKRGG